MTTSQEEQILRNIGAAIIAKWAELPQDIRQLLVDSALTFDIGPAAESQQQLEMFTTKREPHLPLD